MMIIAFLPQAVFAEGEETGAVQLPEKIENPYMAQDFCKLADGNMLSLSEGMDDTTLTGELKTIIPTLMRLNSSENGFPADKTGSMRILSH